MWGISNHKIGLIKRRTKSRHKIGGYEFGNFTNSQRKFWRFKHREVSNEDTGGKELIKGKELTQEVGYYPEKPPDCSTTEEENMVYNNDLALTTSIHIQPLVSHQSNP